MALCSKMEKCRFDIHRKLQQWQIGKAVQDEIIERLEDLNFINEERFVKAFVRQKLQINKWGKLKIKQALFVKHLPDNLVNKYLEEIQKPGYISILENILLKKNNSIKETEKYERKVKLVRYGTSHGFEYDLVIEQTENILNKI